MPIIILQFSVSKVFFTIFSGYRSRIEDVIESGVSIITYAYGTTIPDGSLDNTMRRWSPDRRTRFVTDRASNLDRDEMSIHEDEDDQVSFMTTLCQEIPCKIIAPFSTPLTPTFLSIFGLCAIFSALPFQYCFAPLDLMLRFLQ